MRFVRHRHIVYHMWYNNNRYSTNRSINSVNLLPTLCTVVLHYNVYIGIDSTAYPMDIYIIYYKQYISII